MSAIGDAIAQLESTIVDTPTITVAAAQELLRNIAVLRTEIVVFRNQAFGDLTQEQWNALYLPPTSNKVVALNRS